MDGLADPATVEPCKEITGIGIAKVRLAARGRAKPGERGLGNAVRAVAAAREPHRIERRVIRAFREGFKPLRVAAREMALFEKALRVECEVEPREIRGQSKDRRSILLGDRAGGRADGDTGHSAS